MAKPNNNNNKAKQNTAKPNKVQVTVKAPCQEAIEKAVAAAMHAHIKVSLKLFRTLQCLCPAIARWRDETNK